MDLNDKVEFLGAKKSEIYRIRDIAVVDFKNKIFRRGFYYGFVIGSGLVTVVIIAILSYR